MFPGKGGAVSNSDYPGVLKEFYWKATRFIGTGLAPTAADVAEHVVLIPAAASPPGVPKEDLAFLLRQTEKYDVLLVQSGGDFGELYIFIRLREGAFSPENFSEEAELAHWLSEFVILDNLAAIEFTSQLDGDQLIFTGIDPKSKRKRLSGMAWKKGIFVIVPKTQVGDHVPKVTASRSQWFELAKDSGSGRTLEDYRYNREGIPSLQEVARRNGQRLHSPKRHDKFEEEEQQLKAMPEADARRACLKKAQELADAPDAEPEKLAFYIRGLGRPLDPPQAKVLRQILRLTHNNELRAAAIRQLSKWIVDDADSRQTIVADLAARLQDPNQQVRQDALRAIGQGGDIRQLEKVMPLLDAPDAQVRETALKAMADLLGWELPKPPDAATTQQQLEQAKLAGESVVRSLAEAERLIGGKKSQ